jgi:hypothetical protein
MNQRQLHIIDYLREENRILREQLGGRRVRFNDDQRRRLAAKAKGLGRRMLAEVATMVAPETWLAWHRKLSAQKYDGRSKRRPGDLARLERSRLGCFAGQTRTAIGAIGASRAHGPIWDTTLPAA